MNGSNRLEAAKNSFYKDKNVLTVTVDGDKDNYKIISIDLPNFDKEESWNQVKKEEASELGGILLSPVFALINFVADAIMSNLDTIMTEGDASFSSVMGLGIMQEGTVAQEAGKEYETYTVDMNKLNIVGDVQYPNIRYTPEEIFLGKIDLLSIDFISGKNYEGETNQSSGWLEIRKVISQWYQVLRMVAIIGLLSVLIYTGIKVMLSANAKDKAKYKEWIMDWFMAAAILFSMHIIMAFIVSVTGEFSKLIGNSSKGILINGASASNLVGLVRFMVQADDFYIKIGYEVMYIALICYTIKFTFIYLKRVLNMAFLTLIAPIVALTYTLDKINDGKAQGFEMWLKEYIFNALLQPMHCVLYYVLVGSAVELAASNPIYGIVVLAFMSQAEKLLKKIFGFEKAGGGTVGGMAGAFAAGAVASNIAKMAKGIGGGKGSSGNGGNAGKEDAMLNDAKIKEDTPLTDRFSNTLLGDGNSSQDKDSSEKENNQTNPESSPNNEENDNKEEKLDGGNPQNENNNEEKLDGGNPQEENGEGSPNEGNVQESIWEKAKRKDKERLDKLSEEDREKVKARRRAIKNVIRPIHDIDRHGTGYNKERWKRRGVNALKGTFKAGVGAALGVGAAAVQAGISITDGKYNPLEGVASFGAGYAGGKNIISKAGGAWSNVSNAWNEGYYEGNTSKLVEKKQKEFMYNDKVFNAYKSKYGDKAVEKMKLTRDQMIPHGISDTKEQFGIHKMADELVSRNIQNGYKGDEGELRKRAVDEARNAKGFVDLLESQGMKKLIREPAGRADYIKSEIKARGLKEGSKEANDLTNSLNNAFRSAAAWQSINGK